eukprot:scaffold15089_cov168-Amphora_coffeaeformis.AAC.9
MSKIRTLSQSSATRLSEAHSVCDALVTSDSDLLFLLRLHLFRRQMKEAAHCRTHHPKCDRGVGTRPREG